MAKSLLPVKKGKACYVSLETPLHMLPRETLKDTEYMGKDNQKINLRSKYGTVEQTLSTFVVLVDIITAISGLSYPLAALSSLTKSTYADDPGSWPEDYDQENGQYINNCCACSKPFAGNKHRRTCRMCIEKNEVNQVGITILELRKVVSSLNSGINGKYVYEAMDLNTVRVTAPGIVSGHITITLSDEDRTLIQSPDEVLINVLIAHDRLSHSLMTSSGIKLMVGYISGLTGSMTRDQLYLYLTNTSLPNDGFYRVDPIGEIAKSAHWYNNNVRSTKIHMILAMDIYNGIGKNDTLPWNIPEDLAYFKAITMGAPIVMGRKTFESIGRPLPGRTNIVVTRDDNWSHDGVDVFGNLDDAILYAKEAKVCSGVSSKGIFVIGGATLYNAIAPFADIVHVTHVRGDFECDVRVDDFLSNFNELDPGELLKSKTGTGYRIAVYTKKV